MNKITKLLLLAAVISLLLVVGTIDWELLPNLTSSNMLFIVISLFVWMFSGSLTYGLTINKPHSASNLTIIAVFMTIGVVVALFTSITAWYLGACIFIIVAGGIIAHSSKNINVWDGVGIFACLCVLLGCGASIVWLIQKAVHIHSLILPLPYVFLTLYAAVSGWKIEKQEKGVRQARPLTLP